ncbi:MAG: glycogen-debranching protein, partial [Verrucomicrobia bacterium]|nr:glycogen-debranching protein [Verrucomicrobiota bacterium]
LAKDTYYIFDEKGEYCNFSGTGNTFNCNNPTVSQFIIDSLSYWTDEMQVDGFRFDLGSIFTRGPDGLVMKEPPLLELMRKAPALQNTLFIAEAWDAAGLYQVGSFPGEKRWSEWNGKYRDTVRRFIKGTDGEIASFMQAICGSQELYFENTPLQSINFITCHDGFSLHDLVSYQEKHNEMNKENNKDGMNDNQNWNCGTEGSTIDKEILLLRNRQMKNFQMVLLLSVGVPMMLMGDEYGHTKQGNNNTYCQDNNLNYFLWDELENKKDLFQFVKKLISFRKEKKDLFCRDSFLSEKDVTWINVDWAPSNHFLSFILKDHKQGKDCLIAFNAHHLPIEFQLPSYTKWSRVADTALSSPLDFIEEIDKRPKLKDTYLIGPRSAIIAEAIYSR